MINKISSSELFKIANLQGRQKDKFNTEYVEAQKIVKQLEDTKPRTLKILRKNAEDINEDMEVMFYDRRTVSLGNEDVYTINFWDDAVNDFHFKIFAPAVVTAFFKDDDGYTFERIDGYGVCFIGI